jgi:fatty acid desaturase
MTAGQLPARAARASDFAPLLRSVRAAGLLRPRRLHYAALIAADLLAYAGVWFAVYSLGASWWALLLAIPAALFTMRIIFLGHDVAHGQIARTSKVNDRMAVVIGDVLSGLGSRWWADKHNRHHANPNQVGADPDVAPGALAWTAEQTAARSSRLGALAARHQGSLYLPMLLGEAFNLKVASFRAVRTVRDVALLSAHLTVYLGGLVLMLGPGRAAVFVVAHQALVGLHLGLVFAPGHKGMAMPAAGTRHDYLRKQVLTTRNVRGGRVVDWLFGGLNYQIEHHLFPSMPRPSLRHAQFLVRTHCAKLDLPYCSETVRASLGLTIRHLHAAGRRPVPVDAAA